MFTITEKNKNLKVGAIQCTCGSNNITLYYHYTGLQIHCRDCQNSTTLHAKEYGQDYFGDTNNTYIGLCDCLVEDAYQDRLKTPYKSV